MKLIVGLGNPGKKYEKTRHNMGFETIDKLASSFCETIDKSGFKGLYKNIKYFDEDIILLKPMTFMNLSGESVLELACYFKIDPEDIIVIYDDVDFEPGKIKIKLDGSSGGHNGLKSIISCLKSEKFIHVRIGIGKPQFPLIDWVLSKPIKDERVLIEEAQNKAVEAIKFGLKENFDKAMSLYNK